MRPSDVTDSQYLAQIANICRNPVAAALPAQGSFFGAGFCPVCSTPVIGESLCNRCREHHGQPGRADRVVVLTHAVKGEQGYADLEFFL